MISIVTFITGFIFLSIVQPTSDAGIFGCVTAVIVVFSMAFALDLRRSKIFRDFGLAIFSGYLFRIVIIYLSVYGKQIIQFPNDGADSGMYYSSAIGFVETGEPGQGGMFSRIMGTFFSFTGGSYLWGQFMVSLFSIIAILFFVLIIKKLKVDDKTEKLITWIICLLPNYAILSSVFLRESIVCMFITISLFCFVSWMKERNHIWFLFAFATALAGGAIHGGSAAIVGGYIIVLLVYDKNNNCIRVDALNVIAMIFVSGAVLLLYIRFGDLLFNKLGSISSIEDVGNTLVEGGTTYAPYVGDTSSIANMILFTIPRIVFLLFSPFPFQWRNASDIIAFLLSSMFYIMAFWNGIKAIYYSKDKKTKSFAIVMFIIMICAVFIYGWGVSNSGTAARHRDKLVMLFGILMAIGIGINKKRNAETS